MAKTKAKPPAAPAPEEVRAPAPTAAAPPLPGVSQRLRQTGYFTPDQLTPSPTNPRGPFEEWGDEAELRELAGSIRATGGIAQALVVRLHVQDGHPAPRYEGGKWIGLSWVEIVCGERRWRAAKLAGLDRIPCDVAALSDEEVLTIQTVENDQRKGVRPSRQAAGYARLREKLGTDEAVAAAVGKSPAFVAGLIRLGRLPAWALAAVDDGRFPRATAEQVARLPGEESRKWAAACALFGTTYVYDDLQEDIEDLDAGKDPTKNPAWLDDHDPPLTYRKVKELIARSFQKELKSARFGRKALDLIDGVGSCDDCPKRAGNDAEAIAEKVRADMCLDPVCYAAKTEAWDKKLIATAKETGRTVLAAKEGDKLFNKYGDGLAYGSGYIDLDAKCYEDSKSRTYRQLLKGHVADEKIVIAVGPKTGRPVELVKKETAAKVLKDEYKLGAKSSTTSADERWKKDQADRRKKAEAGKRAALAANGQVAAKMRDAVPPGGAVFQGGVALLQQVAATVADFAGADACRAIAKRRELSKEKYGERAAVEQLALSLTEPRELLALIAECASARQNWAWGNGYSPPDKDEKAFWKAFGVDQSALMKDAQAEQKKPKAKKGKAPEPDKPRNKPGAAPQCVAVGKCRICGCVEADCSSCIERTGEPCRWTSPAKDLCTACLPLLEADVSVLFIGPHGTPDQGTMTKLDAAMVRTIGHVLALDAKTPPKGLTAGKVEDLKRAAKKRIEIELEAGGPSDTRIAAEMEAPPLPVSKPSSELYLRLVPGFPVAAANELALIKVLTLADLKKRVGEQSTAVNEDGRLYAAIRETPGIDPQTARQAMDAVLGYFDQGHSSKSLAELEKLTPTKKPKKKAVQK